MSKNPRPVSDLCGCARIPPKSRGSPLNGVEPAGTMLEYNSFNSLRNEPSAGNRTIRLQPNLTMEALSGSEVSSPIGLIRLYWT